MVDPATIGFVFAVVGLVSTMVLFGIALFGITQLEEINRSMVDTGPSQDSSSDPLEELRTRYARGELTDEEFDRKVERLVTTENGTGKLESGLDSTQSQPYSSRELNLESDE